MEANYNQMLMFNKCVMGNAKTGCYAYISLQTLGQVCM